MKEQVIGSAHAASTGETGGSKRILGKWDLIFYGIVLNQPVAAVGLFGLVNLISGGHMVTTLLMSMVAMLLTAVSYGRMAAKYPTAGSAYKYVGKGLNPYLGFMAGWAMTLCYLIIPIINAVFGVLSFQRLFPGTPYWLGVIVFICLVSFLNLLGVRSSMNANKVMLYVMLIIIGSFIVLAVRYILNDSGVSGLITTEPFFNPETFKFGTLAAGTSLVALTYVGFDGITTLAEDVKNPKKNILVAIITVCLFTGLFSGLQMYLAQGTAQSMWLEGGIGSHLPFYERIPKENIETAFFTVCKQVGGQLLFNAMTITMLIACVASGLAGQLGAAKLLYGMGKDNVLPRKFFGYQNTSRNSPVNNILLIGGLSIIGALALNYQKTAELINFAALIAFMGVNLAAIGQFYFKSPVVQRNLFTDLIVPAGGFLFCLWIWLSLPITPMIIGGIWLICGAFYLAVSTKGFRIKPVMLDFKDV
ncbi:MAG: APC family permease [Bacteroidota bacterium]